LGVVTTGAITGGITGFTERFIYGGMMGEDISSNLWDSSIEGTMGIFLGGGFSAIGKVTGAASKLFNEFKGIREYIATYLKRIGTSKYAQFLRNNADEIPQQMNHWDEMIKEGEDAWMMHHKPGNIHPTGFQTSMGGKFVIPKNQEGTKFLYNMDENGLLSIVHSVPDTSHLKFGQFSRGAGEVSFHTMGELNVAQVNAVTSNYNTNIKKVIDAFESLGYLVVEHPGPMGATINPPTFLH
jgi:hypothetical protein